MSSETTEAATEVPPTPPNETEAPAEESKAEGNQAVANNPETETKTEQTKKASSAQARKIKVDKTANKESPAPAQPTKKAPSRRASIMASLQAENTQLRRELAKHKETIARLKRGQRARHTPTTVQKKKNPAEQEKARPRKITRVSNRLYNPRHEQNKASKRATAKKKSELGKCSFKPQRLAKVASKKDKIKEKAKNKDKIKEKAKNTHAFNRLYRDADRLARKRAEKAQEQKDAKVKRFSFTPEVSEKSRKLQEGVSRRERLSRLSEPKPKPEVNAPTMQKEDLIECTFKPRINPDNVYTPEGPLHQRLYQAGLQAKEKMAKIRENKVNREFEQALSACTFQPNSGTAPKRSGQEMRKIVERLAVQDVERRLNNLNNSVKESSLGMSFAPEINQRTRQMTQTRDGNVTERLYTVKMPVNDAPLDEECTFVPAVTQMAFEVDRSELPVHERLALHRSPSQREAFADMDGYQNAEEEESGEGEESEEVDEEEELEEAEEDSEDEGADSEDDITF